MQKLELLLEKVKNEVLFVRNKPVNIEMVKAHFSLCLEKGIDEYNALKTIFVSNKKIQLLCWE